MMPLWQPHWINASYRVRVLEDPHKIFGEGDRAYLLANNALKDKVTPEVLARLARIKLSVAAVTEMDRMVNVEKVSPREAARRWIALRGSGSFLSVRASNDVNDRRARSQPPRCPTHSTSRIFPMPTSLPSRSRAARPRIVS